MKKPYHIRYSLLISILGVLLISSCNKDWWDEYYNLNEERVNMPLWEVVRENPDFSTFVGLIEKYGMDSLFTKDISYTLFIPSNAAFELPNDTAGIMVGILSNHISNNLFLTRNVQGSRKLENLAGKFPLVESTGYGYTYDGVVIEKSSPLYQDGVYYELAEVAVPLPNLYEFTERFSPVIRSFIDMSDSVYLNINESTALRFDSMGNTIYDSVFSSVNRFERDFFPVSKEFRDRAATFVLFTQEQYDLALDNMASELGSAFADHNDIPKVWQNEILLPSALSNSLFDNELDYFQFSDYMASITGDSVNVDVANIDPDSKYQCSNGVVYTYLNFSVPSKLYRGSIKIEGENMVDSLGLNTYAFKPGFGTFGTYFNPIVNVANDASGGRLLNISFPRSYGGEWGINLTIRNVFPLKYRLEWQANFRPSGNYKVYVNDELLTYKNRFGDVLDEFDTYELNKSVLSVTGNLFIPKGGINKRDYFVENLNEFGDVVVKIEYVGSGTQETNGFNIDYIALIPVD